MLAVSPSALRWIDIHLLDETLKDAWGRWRYSEDWADAPAMPPGLDSRWLQLSPRPIPVAHAFGEASLPEMNSLAALQRGLQAGFRLLEVDIWLDGAGQLRCHHGPELPPTFKAGDCTLLAAAQAAARADAWLVLDIKTDFEATSAVIVQQFKAEPSASRLVFQLYRPSDVHHFVGLASTLPVPGPLVTAYQARRSLRHIASQMNRLGIKALTVPLYRGEALPLHRPQGVVLLMHPVHDCEALNRARGFNADGFYLRTEMLPRLQEGCAER